MAFDSNAVEPSAIYSRSCAACHGHSGNSLDGTIPSLAGQPRVFLETQLVMIREGLRVVPSMAGIMSGINDKQIEEISGWLAQQPVGKPAGKVDIKKFSEGQVLSARFLCGTCHMPKFQGQSQVPRLANQHERYLTLTMTAMRDGQATGRDTIMSGTLVGITNAQIESMSHYLSNLSDR